MTKTTQQQHLSAEEHADAGNNNPHRRRRRTAPQHLDHHPTRGLQDVGVQLTMVDGSGIPLDCSAILSDGPPVFGEPAPPAEDSTGTAAGTGTGAAGTSTAAAVANAGGVENVDGRDTNGSFDESVMLYQLCLQQEEAKQDGGAVESGNSNNNNADADGTGSVIYVGPDEAAGIHDASATNTNTNASGGLRLKYLCAPYDDPTSAPTTASSTPGSKPRGKFLSYSYDVHVRTTTHVLEAGAEYEATMVRYLAKKLGLDECTGGAEGGRRTFRLLKSRALRRRSLQDVEVNYKDNVPVVVGISAEPRDMPNYDAGECLAWMFSCGAVVEFCRAVIGWFWFGFWFCILSTSQHLFRTLVTTHALLIFI